MIPVPVAFKSKLSRHHNLFVTLKNNPPMWWNAVKSHPELYIEVRKDNYINIYYKGGSIAKLEYDDSTKSLKVTTHPKYLGKDNYMDAKCYYQAERERKKIYMPIYQDCGDWLKDKLGEMLSNVDRYYDSKEKQEQSRMIRTNRNQYIDSEFEHLYTRYRISDKKYKNDYMRIDLVEICNNRIRFVELKMIDDSRLLKKEESVSPEIYGQMQKYRIFADRFKDNLLEYYREVYRIKEDLDLPRPYADVNALAIDTKPLLVIANDYSKETKGRTERIRRINRKMIQKSDVFNYECLPEKNYANNHS